MMVRNWRHIVEKSLHNYVKLRKNGQNEHATELVCKIPAKRVLPPMFKPVWQQMSNNRLRLSDSYTFQAAVS